MPGGGWAQLELTDALMPPKKTTQEWILPRGHEERETFHINHSPLLPTLSPPLSYHLIAEPAGKARQRSSIAKEIW